MQKKYSMSKSTYFTAYRELFHTNSATWLIYGVQIFAGLIIGALLYWLNIDYLIPNWIISLMVPVFVFLIIMFVHKHTVNSLFKELPERFDGQQFEIVNGGIYDHAHNKTVTLIKLETFRKSKNYLFLFGSDAESFFIFPKSLFSESEISQIEKWFGG